jgi:hypothetical protein
LQMYSIRLTRSLPLLLFLGALLSAVAGAQTPGIPVLQNGFLNPGLAIAADFGGGGGQSFAGLAGAWGLGASARSGSARIQLSAAAGAGRANGAVRGAYGGRATFAAWSSAGGTLGIGAFAGMGGAPRTRANGTVNNAAVLMVPAGVTVGYRRPLGATRGMSIYASPMYSWVRTSTDVSTVSSGGFRAAVGFDFAFSPSLGATIGGEFGATQFKTTTGKGGSGTFGAAISFVPGRRGGGAQ